MTRLLQLKLPAVCGPYPAGSDVFVLVVDFTQVVASGSYQAMWAAWRLWTWLPGGYVEETDT